MYLYGQDDIMESRPHCIYNKSLLQHLPKWENNAYNDAKQDYGFSQITPIYSAKAGEFCHAVKSIVDKIDGVMASLRYISFYYN